MKWWQYAKARGPIELREVDVFSHGSELPLPNGVSKKDLYLFLRSIHIPYAPHDEMVNYCEQHVQRFVYTYGLVRDLRGKCLDIGAAPYFITMLLRQFTKLELILADYREASCKDDNVTREISYTDCYTKERKSFKFESRIFNVEKDSLPYDDSEFDVVLFCELIEHLIMDPVAVLMEIKRVLKPKGVLVITTPNVNRLENVVKIISGDNIYDPYSGYGPYGRHNREYNMHELLLLLGYCGFTIDTMFTADVRENLAKNHPLIIQLETNLEKRRHDLGQCIFISALNTKDAGKKKPAFLYTNYPPDELEEVTIASVQLQEDIIVQEPSLIKLGKGWHGLESWDNIPTRWMEDDAYLIVYSDETRIAEMSFHVQSFYCPRTLEIRTEDTLVPRMTVPTSFITIRTSIPLKKGTNKLRFHVLEGSKRPCDSPEPKNMDPRRLSLAIQKIMIDR